jgi:hypothetical protein
MDQIHILWTQNATKLPKYSNTLTPEKPSEQSTPYKNTYNFPPKNKEAINMTTEGYTKPKCMDCPL